MKTTELFVEQVLIGLLVMLIVGLVFFHPLMGFYEQHPGSPGLLAQIVTGGFLLGAAYLIGMVYDRIADTLLQDVEAHGRLNFVARMRTAHVDGSIERGEDPFEEGSYRIVVLDNGQATDYMEYLRSRIRLTRALATLVPGIMVSLLLAMDAGKASPWWKTVAITIPAVYLATFLLKIRRRKHFARRTIYGLTGFLKVRGSFGARRTDWSILQFSTQPPRTYESMKLKRYLTLTRSLGKHRNPLKRPPLFFLFQDELLLALVLLVIAATALILSTRSFARFSIVIAGLALTVIVGWSWWRISGTFYAFLRDYESVTRPGRLHTHS